MILYFIIIGICMVIIGLANILFATQISSIYSILAVIILTASAYILDLAIATIVFVLPKKIFNPFSKFFKVHNFEKSFYEHLAIRKWKDLIPIGKGPVGIGFAKNTVEVIKSNDYIYRFLNDSCMAEFMHILSTLLSFIVVLISPKAVRWSIALPVALVNMFLQILPIFVQRYNRPKLITLYNRNLKQQTLPEVNSQKKEG